MLAGVRWAMLVAALLLSVIGLATVHSASSELALDYLPRQALWVGVGLLVFLVSFSLDYQTLTKFALGIYLVSIATLVLVLFVGQEAGGSKSWLGFGSYRIQPSEFAKIATALFLARYLANRNRLILRTHEVIVASAIVGLPMVLIVLESDLGGAAMFVPMLVGMLWLSGLHWRFIVACLLIALVIGVAAWGLVLQDYQKERVRTFLSPDRDPLGAGYQLQQSKIAVGSGQFLGRGYQQGTQSQLRFLPARHTDFILSVLAEEWGFLGVAAVMSLYAIYILNGARVALRARDRVGILLVVGLLSMFTFHVLYNSAMVVGLVPITGIPLPFLSYGGSFTLANFIATGLILGVDFRRFVNR
jgi:rod shape determining protein RodA